MVTSASVPGGLVGVGLGFAGLDRAGALVGVGLALVFDPPTASVGVYRAGEIPLRYSNGDALTVPVWTDSQLNEPQPV